MSRRKRGRGGPRSGYTARPSTEVEISAGKAPVVPLRGALAGRSGNTATMIPLTEVISALTQGGPGGYASVPMPADPRQRDPFGPGNPLHIAAIDTPRLDTGRPEPRVTEYPVNANVQLTSDRPIDWKLLRKASTDVDLIRLCIEKRKEHVKPLKYGWTVSEDAIESQLLEKGVHPGQAKAAKQDIEAELRQRLQPEIARLNAWWRKPWKSNQLSFKQWVGLILEEWLVLDAVVIYPEMSYGGDVLNFKVIDGATIKPLRDVQGEIPDPPYPAFQQMLYGYPRGEFTATLSAGEDGSTLIENAYLPDQLYYYRSTVRTTTPYGMSAVERALIAARLWLNRQGWLISEYDDGTGPLTWLVPPENAGEAMGEAFTPQKRREWQRAYNDENRGNTSGRHGTQITPPGFKPVTMPQADERYRPNYDMFLIRILSSHLGMTMPELNFTEPGGLGSTGYHEGQEDVQERVGTQPSIDFIQTIVTDLAHTYQDAPPELEFRIWGLDSDDEAAQDAVIKDKYSTARMTLNETRDAQGRARYDFREADMPMVLTSRGVLFLEGAADLAAAGQLVVPPQASPDAAGGNADGAAGAGKTAAGPDGAPEPVSAASKAAELDAYGRWSVKSWANKPGARPFEFRVVTAAEGIAAGVDLARAVFKAAGGGADPKDDEDGEEGEDDVDEPADATQWPGWQHDLAATDHWAAALIAALLAAVDAAALARDWIQYLATVPGASGPPGKARDDAIAAASAVWVGRETDALTVALTDILNGTYTDGYLIGAASARAVMDGLPIELGGWTAGDEDAATLLLGKLGDGSGLRTLLNESGVRIRSVVASRLNELGRALATGAGRGDSVDTIARAIRGILSDASRAYMVAGTELARAVSAAAANGYRNRGLSYGSWSTAADQRVCVTCESNQTAGAIRLGEPYPGGVDYPPQHPLCRCALLPATRDEAA